MPRTQNSATNAWNFTSQANNNNKSNTYRVLPSFDWGKTMEYIPIERIDKAYRQCCRHKTQSKSRAEYSLDYELENLRLWRELNDMTYRRSEAKAFCVTRPKLREVICSAFRDRVVDTLLVGEFLPLFEAEMTDRAYACRKGMGTDYGIEDIAKQIDKITHGYTRKAWVLKGDISGFFMSIDRRMLWNVVEDVIRSKYKGENVEWWLWLWRMVIMNAPEKSCVRIGDLKLWEKLPKNKSLFTNGEDRGLPIGNLPSQVLANLMMSRFDKWAIARMQGYGRYVDDFIMIDTDKKRLLNSLSEARRWLKIELGLTLHPDKVWLQEADKGVTFTGAVIKRGRIYALNRNIGNVYNVIEAWNRTSSPTAEQARRFCKRMNSMMGMLRRRNEYALRWRLWRLTGHKNIIYCKNLTTYKTRRI